MSHRTLLHPFLLAALLGAGNNTALAQTPFFGYPGDAPSAEAPAPPTTAREALDTMSRLVELRSMTNPHGYEKNLEFTSKFHSIRGQIQSLINNGTSATLSSNEILEVVGPALRQYEDNRYDFASFYLDKIKPSLLTPEERQPTDTTLARMHPVDIAANILSLYLFVQAKNPFLADLMKKGSYIWPFCRTLDHGTSGANSGISPKQLLLQVDMLMKDNFSLHSSQSLSDMRSSTKPLRLKTWRNGNYGECPDR
jgi:hypothetical protein